MAKRAIKEVWSLRISPKMMEELEAHLFPGDNDEHGAVIAAQVVRSRRGNMLLAMKLFVAKDDVDYVAGDIGYRKLTSDFVHRSVDYCASHRLAYLAIHCHGGNDEVEFSNTDLLSQKQGYPALLDILDGPPVVGLVFAEKAAAGVVWLPDRSTYRLSYVRIPEKPQRVLYAKQASSPLARAIYDRQSLIFGNVGQELLSSQKVGIIGAGGVGSLLVEYLARLGVGHLVVIDPERAAPSNTPRLVGSLRRDVVWLKNDALMYYFPKIFFTKKIKIAKRVAKKANPSIKFTAMADSIVEPRAAQALKDCDFIFLAADSEQAKHVFSALVSQYLVAGTQVASKVSTNSETGKVNDIYSVIRTFYPGSGCLWCNGLINSARLNNEAKSENERIRQRYVNDEEVHAPSVITLNAVAASHAVDQYLFSTIGMSKNDDEHPAVFFHPLESAPSHRARFEEMTRDAKCPECKKRLSQGDSVRLPTKWEE